MSPYLFFWHFFCQIGNFEIQTFLAIFLAIFLATFLPKVSEDEGGMSTKGRAAPEGEECFAAPNASGWEWTWGSGGWK